MTLTDWEPKVGHTVRSLISGDDEFEAPITAIDLKGRYVVDGFPHYLNEIAPRRVVLPADYAGESIALDPPIVYGERCVLEATAQTSPPRKPQ
jgi:hypothetical protein